MAASFTAVFIPDRFICQQVRFLLLHVQHRMIIVATRRWLDRIPATARQ